MLGRPPRRSPFIRAAETAAAESPRSTRASSATSTACAGWRRAGVGLGWKLRDELIVGPSPDGDGAGLLETPDRLDDLGMRLLHLLEADRPEQVDLLEQVLRGALGEVLGDL